MAGALEQLALRVAFARLPIRALDIVEVAPPLDHDDITSRAAVRVIYEVLGWVKDEAPAEQKSIVESTAR